MGRYGLDAAVYPISRKKWEAPYPVELFDTKSDFYEKKEMTNNRNTKPLKKTTSKVGDRVFSQKNKRTAIIIDSTMDRIIIRFDDDGTICKYAKNIWILKTPFLPMLSTAI